MRSGDAIPSVGLDVPLVKALLEITQKGMGMTAVVDADGRPLGVFTDGDLRRVIERMHDFSNVLIRDVMHANPRSVRPEQLAVDAVAVMEEFRINQMLVVDADGPAGRRAAHPRPDPRQGDLMNTPVLAHIERAARIKVMIFDVDGVLTDGSLTYGPDGEVTKTFNVLDGLGIQLLQ